MKNTITVAIALLFGLGIQAQNTNVKNVTKKTTTTTKDSDGNKQVVKEENVQQKQNIQFENSDSNSLNKDVKPSPIESITRTTITNPDGTTRTVATDRSSTYDFEGYRYTLALDPSGYLVTDTGSKQIGLLRATTNNSYIFRGEDSISVGYFDIDGNLVMDTYDEKSDKVTTRTFNRIQK